MTGRVCPSCGGLGMIKVYPPLEGTVSYLGDRAICPECDGRGVVPDLRGIDAALLVVSGAVALLLVALVIGAIIAPRSAGAPPSAPQGTERATLARTVEPTPTPSPTPNPATTAPPATAWTRAGIASTYGPGFDGYIASPDWPRGSILEICGPGACVLRVTNDVGPDQSIHPDRVVDLDVQTFEVVCAVDWTRGLCPVVVTLVSLP